uniref:Transposase n=1 Tax=Steinernema glaseri TaxID=37863 RepID=A0A1I7YC37_9BILA
MGNPRSEVWNTNVEKTRSGTIVPAVMKDARILFVLVQPLVSSGVPVKTDLCADGTENASSRANALLILTVLRLPA